MPIFVELVTDAFEEVLGNEVSRRTADGRAARSGRQIARRPTRGLEIKEDTKIETQMIKVITDTMQTMIP